ncbi:MAG: YlxR family protein [Chloroflexi bacterium]|nr:YlxR family protein [Chloroflexota bacterium]
MTAKAKKAQPVPRRHVPQRTCVACRQVRAKRDLVRIVRAADGAVRVDPTGKLAGRGAYICRARPCWEQGLRAHALEHALKTSLSAEDRAGLVAFAQTLPATLGVGGPGDGGQGPGAG